MEAGALSRVRAFGAASRVPELDIEARPRLNPRTEPWGLVFRRWTGGWLVEANPMTGDFWEQSTAIGYRLMAIG